MHSGISRTKLARYVTDRLEAAQTDVLRELAAYLVTMGRTREADLIIREITEQFERRGIVSAEVVSAAPIDATLRQSIADMLGAKKMELHETIDESVLGGIRVTTASRELDATIAHRIAKLRATQGATA